MSDMAQDGMSTSPTVPTSTEPPTPKSFASTGITRPSLSNQTTTARVIRRYGKQQKVVEEEPVTEEGNGKSLARESTSVIPETDPVDEMEMETERNVGGIEVNSSSQVDSSEPRSTSPTSEEGEKEDEATGRKENRRPVNDLLGNLSDDSSEDEDTREGGGIDDFFAKHGNLADQLKAVDDEIDTRAEESPARPRKALEPPTSSSLPTLTDSDAVSSQPNPAASTRLLNSTEDEDEETQAVVAPSARLHIKKKRAIVDSEDEDSENEANKTIQARRLSTSPARSPTLEPSSDREGDLGISSPVRIAPSLPATSKERLFELAARKKKNQPPTPPPPPPRKERDPTSDAIEDASSEDESRKKRKSKKSSGKPKVKGLSKKEQAEMNKMTAQLARGQEARLVPVTKNTFKVTDVLKESRSNRSVSTAPLVPTSSDEIITTSSPRSKILQPSAKALGKQRQHSPIELSDNEPTPQASRDGRKLVKAPTAPWGSKKYAQTSAPTKPSDDEDSDDDLLSLDQVLAKEKEEKQKKAEREREKLEKQRAREEMIKAARAKARAKSNSDSDSDIEIEGAPVFSKTTRQTTTHSRSTPVPGTQLRHVLTDFARVNPSHDEVDPSESQLRNAGRDFGSNLDPAQHYSNSLPSKNRPSSTASKAKQPVTINQTSLNHVLMQKAQQQSLQARLKKQTAHRQQQQPEQTKTDSDRVDLTGLIEKKKKQREEEKEEDERIEEEEDSDYKAESEVGEEEDAQMSDANELGSGSDVPDPEPKGDIDFEEGEFNSDGELVMPASSQNSDRLGHRNDLAAQSQEEEDEEDVLPVARKVKPRVVVDDESEEEEEQTKSSLNSTVPTPLATEVVPEAQEVAPVRIQFGDVFGGVNGGDDGGGFSQFFNSQFSQAVGGDNDEEGFARPRDPTPVAPTMFIAEPLISTAERAADAALLEARGGIHKVDSGTPRQAAIPRQYINKQGFMTQTRPVGLFADSPSFSPHESQQFPASLSTAQDSQSQSQSQGFTQTQTQVNATPTQALRHPNQLRRQAALIRTESISEEIPDPTEVVPMLQEDDDDEEEEEEEEEEAGESFPSAAQPRNAFETLRKGAAAAVGLASIPEKPKRGRRETNAFIQDQANLDSDEEGADGGGLNAASEDEDETGHDEELTELVNNEAISEELQAVQDAKAQELFREEGDKRDAAELKRAQAVADGKLRNKRAAYDLGDDDFDDEWKKQEHREKKQRTDHLTTAQLLEHPETKSFGKQIQSTSIAKYNEDLFEPSQANEYELNEEDEMEDESYLESQDPFGGEPVPKVKTSYADARLEAVQRQKEIEEERLKADEFDTQAYTDVRYGYSSSPIANYKTNNRIQAAASKPSVPRAQKDDFDQIESQYSVVRAESIKISYKTGDSREESQGGGGGGGNGVSAGGRSAVTSFKTGPPSRSNSTSSSTGSSSRRSTSTTSRRTDTPVTSALSGKSSKFGFRKNHGFA